MDLVFFRPSNLREVVSAALGDSAGRELKVDRLVFDEDVVASLEEVIALTLHDPAMLGRYFPTRQQLAIAVEDLRSENAHRASLAKEWLRENLSPGLSDYLTLLFLIAPLTNNKAHYMTQAALVFLSADSLLKR